MTQYKPIIYHSFQCYFFLMVPVCIFFSSKFQFQIVVFLDTARDSREKGHCPSATHNTVSGAPNGLLKNYYALVRNLISYEYLDFSEISSIFNIFIPQQTQQKQK